MIKAAFFDIDGTLLSFRDNLPTALTIKALNDLKAKGIKIFISTGRSPSNLEYVHKAIPVEFDGKIMVNGQYCIVGDKVVHEQFIPEEDLVKFIEFLDKEKFSCHFTTIDDLYINFVTDRVTELQKLLGRSLPNNKTAPADFLCKQKIYQLCPYILEEEEILAADYIPNCKFARWHPLFTDVIPKDGGKGTGIKKVCEYLGITTDECIAFGDGGNDAEMLQTVGIGVAMGNARDDLKAIADYVTTSVDEDGVYNALKHFNIL